MLLSWVGPSPVNSETNNRNVPNHRRLPTHLQASRAIFVELHVASTQAMPPPDHVLDHRGDFILVLGPPPTTQVEALES